MRSGYTASEGRGPLEHSEEGPAKPEPLRNYEMKSTPNCNKMGDRVKPRSKVQVIVPFYVCLEKRGATEKPQGQTLPTRPYGPTQRVGNGQHPHCLGVPPNLAQMEEKSLVGS